ncbi:lytic murein transglycosylase [Pseudooceanicola nitratireducens]|uniref:lytic murein transglycosylase n=1 Tax=Pseudooceanicola nitratireducens TaxID=517719 RepID=UPI001FD59FCA|nr:lytic murein transglycosylase [Pseudooceanicola nitratireducens]
MKHVPVKPAGAGYARLAMSMLLGALLSVPATAAELRDRSLRPQLRPGTLVAPARSDAQVIAAMALKALNSETTAQPVRAARNAASLRPKLRPVLENVRTVAYVEAGDPAGFRTWINGFRNRALAKGISGSTFDRTFVQVSYLPEVIKLDRKQSEFTKSTGDYLASAVSDTRVSTGREKAGQHGQVLRAIEGRYGVDRHIVAAIWGMETNYGGYRGKTHVPSALATLAYDGRRGSFFEAQLIATLGILQQGDTTPDRMDGSWAGAMGHTQFMPTSYEAYAVDFTGDGRRDIWGEDPTDALASTAAYLNRMGWVAGQPWGIEVTLPASFNYALAGGSKKMPSDWARLGLRAADGQALRDHGAARVLLPSGAQGPAFLVFKNFDVIKRYNNSDSYALGVGHLGDRISGGGPLRGSWPDGERGLKRAERQELQVLLTRAGFSTQGVDGRIGPNTVDAIRRYQQRVGLTPDGYPSVALLARLRG